MAGTGGGRVCPPAELSFAGEYYTVVDGVCSRASSFFGGKPALGQAVGYAVVLGFGAFFTLFTSFLVWLEKRYVGSQHTSEWFNTAGRSVKTGLIACAIVSQWTWTSTLLQSSNAAWQYGVSGPFWHASGAAIQVLLFGVTAVEVKRKAPNAHTVCEIVRARWGAAAHAVFLAFCLATNVIVAATQLLGGLAGGGLCRIGRRRRPGHEGGYWMSAIAARPSATHKGYLLGGLLWFALPFSLATSLGLGALALDLPLTTEEGAKGLVPAAAITVLMGKSGSILLLTMLFMTVTSSGSAELVAVSSLCTYDIYRTYINPNATGKQILRVSRAVVFVFGCLMGVLAVVLNLVGVSLGWMYMAMGVIIGPAVIPLALLLLWRKANAVGAMLGAGVGSVFGVAVWLTVAKVQYGRVDLDSTSRNAPALAGNLASVLMGGAVHLALFAPKSSIVILFCRNNGEGLIPEIISKQWQDKSETESVLKMACIHVRAGAGCVRVYT
ncbi:hypothetical protein ACP70R_020542 [Stipagrostis hirtigluma subsp. patula]